MLLRNNFVNVGNRLIDVYDQGMNDTPNTHGGKRRRAGRTTELGRGVDIQRVNLSLDEKTQRLLKVVGDGNLSRGVRIAAQLAYEKYQRS